MHNANSKTFRVAMIVFFILLLVSPVIQYQMPFFPQVQLYGVETPPSRPDFTLASWRTGKYAAETERWLARNIGFRGGCIKLLNQCNLLLFNDIQGNSATPLTLGQDGWVYETAYIDDAVNPDLLSESDRYGFIKKLKRTQDILEQRGVIFALAISPSKVSIIPDYLPDAVKARIKKAGKTNYETLIPELMAADICVIDGTALFKSLRGRVDFLFSPGGTHWSYNGSYYFSRYLLAQLARKLPDRIVLPQIDKVIYTLPQEADKDIANLMNLLFCKALAQKLPYPQIRVAPLPMDQRPDMLFIGDSFTHQIMDWMNQFKAARKIDFLYYNKRRFNYPPQDIPGYFLKQILYYGEAVTPDTMDWQTLVFSKDAVVLEINEVLLKDKGWGFIDGLLNALNTSDEGEQPSVDGRSS